MITIDINYANTLRGRYFIKPRQEQSLSGQAAVGFISSKKLYKVTACYESNSGVLIEYSAVEEGIHTPTNQIGGIVSLEVFHMSLKYETIKLLNDNEVLAYTL